MNKIILTLCLIGLAVASNPVAIFHGFGDACANPGMKVKSTIIYFKSIYNVSL